MAAVIDITADGAVVRLTPNDSAPFTPLAPRPPAPAPHPAPQMPPAAASSPQIAEREREQSKPIPWPKARVRMGIGVDGKVSLQATASGKREILRAATLAARTTMRHKAAHKNHMPSTCVRLGIIVGDDAVARLRISLDDESAGEAGSAESSQAAATHRPKATEAIAATAVASPSPTPALKSTPIPRPKARVRMGIGVDGKVSLQATASSKREVLRAATLAARTLYSTSRAARQLAPQPPCSATLASGLSAPVNAPARVAEVVGDSPVNSPVAQLAVVPPQVSKTPTTKRATTEPLTTPTTANDEDAPRGRTRARMRLRTLAVPAALSFRQAALTLAESNSAAACSAPIMESLSQEGSAPSSLSSLPPVQAVAQARPAPPAPASSPPNLRSALSPSVGLLRAFESASRKPLEAPQEGPSTHEPTRHGWTDPSVQENRCTSSTAGPREVGLGSDLGEGASRAANSSDEHLVLLSPTPLPTLTATWPSLRNQGHAPFPGRSRVMRSYGLWPVQTATPEPSAAMGSSAADWRQRVRKLRYVAPNARFAQASPAFRATSTGDTIADGAEVLADLHESRARTAANALGAVSSASAPLLAVRHMERPMSRDLWGYAEPTAWLC